MSYYQYSGYCSGATSQDAQPLNISSNENYFTEIMEKIIVKFLS